MYDAIEACSIADSLHQHQTWSLYGWTFFPFDCHEYDYAPRER
jgi:hypothetical protein